MSFRISLSLLFLLAFAADAHAQNASASSSFAIDAEDLSEIQHARGRSVAMRSGKNAAELTFLVRQDGSGDATTIQAAIDLYQGPTLEYTILIGPGTYVEDVVTDDGGAIDEDSGVRIILVAEQGPGTVTIQGNLTGPSEWSNMQVFDLVLDQSQIGVGSSWTDLFNCTVQNGSGKSAVRDPDIVAGDSIGTSTVQQCLKTHCPAAG